MRRDGRGAERGHLHRALGIGKALQPALAQGIEADNAGASPRGGPQFAQHARMVGARVVAEGEDGVRLLEIVQRHRALAGADGAFERHAAGLVAHVGAIGEVVGAELASEQLVQESRFVAGAARGVEQRLVRAVQRTQLIADQCKGLVPGNGTVAVAGLVIDHGMREPAQVFEEEVALLRQPAHRVPFEDFRCRALGGGLGSHGLGAVLAELERRAMVPVGPGAAGAVEAVGLVGRQQGTRPLDRDVLLRQVAADALQRIPTAGRAIVGAIGLVAHQRTIARGWRGTYVP